MTVVRLEWCLARDRDRWNVVAYKPVTVMVLNLMCCEVGTVVELVYCESRDFSDVNRLARLNE